jgi:hypothetical protein
VHIKREGLLGTAVKMRCPLVESWLLVLPFVTLGFCESSQCIVCVWLGPERW